MLEAVAFHLPTLQLQKQLNHIPKLAEISILNKVRITVVHSKEALRGGVGCVETSPRFDLRAYY